MARGKKTTIPSKGRRSNSLSTASDTSGTVDRKILGATSTYQQSADDDIVETLSPNLRPHAKSNSINLNNVAAALTILAVIGGIIWSAAKFVSQTESNVIGLQVDVKSIKEKTEIVAGEVKNYSAKVLKLEDDMRKKIPEPPPEKK